VTTNLVTTSFSNQATNLQERRPDWIRTTNFLNSEVCRVRWHRHYQYANSLITAHVQWIANDFLAFRFGDFYISIQCFQCWICRFRCVMIQIAKWTMPRYQSPKWFWRRIFRLGWFNSSYTILFWHLIIRNLSEGEMRSADCLFVGEKSHW
jgi:hypothetical protein